MRRSFKLLVVFVTTGLLMLATAVPSFAQGPADFGLFTAFGAASKSYDKGVNPTWGSHKAACDGIAAHNPAMGNGLKSLVLADCAANPPVPPG